MVRYVLYIILSSIVFLCACSDKKSVVSDSEEPIVQKNVRYVAIDIDDIFLPPDGQDVKMDVSDVDTLVALEKEIRKNFGSEDFYFTIGYNSGFYDSTNSGDTAIIQNASEFKWFNHFSRHQHIVSGKYTESAIKDLFEDGKNFESTHELSEYVGKYMVTPLHEGIWEPYDPLYNNFEKYGIEYSSTPELRGRASYGNVKLITRTFFYLASKDNKYSSANKQSLYKKADQSFEIIKNNKYVIFYLHQGNFAEDRLAVELIRDLESIILSQTEYTVKFLPSEKLIEKNHNDIGSL